MQRNPYQYLTPIQNDHFVGRWPLVKDIARDLMLDNGDSHAIIAGRRCGKSSFLFVLAQYLRQQFALAEHSESLALPIMFDFKSAAITSVESFFAYILAEVRRSVDVNTRRRTADAWPAPVKLEAEWFKSLAAQPTLFLRDFEDALGYVLDQLAESGAYVRVVLLIDELDEVVDEPWCMALFNQLRALIYSSELRTRVRLVLTGSRPSQEHMSDRGSPLFNVLRLHYLVALDEEAIRHIAPGFPEQVIHEIWRQSGGHPFLAQYLLHHLWEYTPGEITNATIKDTQAIANQFLFENTNDLEGWARTLGAVGLSVYNILTNSTNWIDRADIIQTLNNPSVDVGRELTSLCYHAVAIASPDWTRFRYTGELFRNWYKSKYLELEITFTLGEIPRFFTNAGFKVEFLDEPDAFLCYPGIPVWERYFDSTRAIYTKVFLGQPLDSQTVMSLFQRAQTTTQQIGYLFFVVVDQALTDSAWLSIGALRADGVRIIPIDDAFMRQARSQQHERQALQSHLRGFIGRQRDLYNVRSPVVDRLNLFGREGVIKELLEILSIGRPLALLGLRKIGKTSLVLALENYASFPVAYIDLQTGVDLANLYGRILAGWQQSLRVKAPTITWTPQPMAADLSNAFQAAVHDLLAQLAVNKIPLRLGLFIDEIELIVPPVSPHLGKGQEQDDLLHYLTFARTLRILVEETGQLSLLVAGVDARLNHVNGWGRQKNPFYQFFREEYIGSLREFDCIQMVRNIGHQMGWVYSEGSAQEIATASGCHPFLTRQLCSIILQVRRKEPGSEISLGDVQAGIAQFVRNPDSSSLLDENGLWGELTAPFLWSPDQITENIAVLEFLAQVEEASEEALLTASQNPTIRQKSLYELTQRSVLRSTNKVLQIQIGLLQQWIRRYRLDLPEPLSPVDTTQMYMRQAGFEVMPGSTSNMFVCQAEHHTWLEHFKHMILVKVLLGDILTKELVLKLVEEATQLLHERPNHILVIYDHAPTDGAWLQIAAERSSGIKVMPVDTLILRNGLQQNRHRQVLLNHLEERYLGPQRDLYDRQNPISDQLNFFGRERLADQLIDNLNHGHAVALFGLRKMGKTSLLHVVRDHLAYPAAAIDLEARTTPEEFYERIVAAWMDRVRTLQLNLHWQTPVLVADETSSTHFTRLVRSLLDALTTADATAQVAVFLDELEWIYPRKESELERYLDFAGTLRALAQEYSGRFGLIVASLDPNIVRTSRLFGQQNPFYNFFRMQYLPPLSGQDCIQMIRNIGVQMGLTYEDDALPFVAEVSGGHPYWARKLCSLAFQTWKGKGEQGPITRQHLVTTARRFIQHPDTAQLLDQRGLWGDVTDRYLWSEEDATANEAILLALAESERRMRPDLLAQATKPAAHERSLVELGERAIIDEVETDTFWIHLQLFRNWIRTDKLGKE